MVGCNCRFAQDILRAVHRALSASRVLFALFCVRVNMYNFSHMPADALSRIAYFLVRDPKLSQIF